MQTSVVIFLDQEDSPNVYRCFPCVNLGFDVLIKAMRRLPDNYGNAAAGM